MPGVERDARVAEIVKKAMAQHHDSRDTHIMEVFAQKVGETAVRLTLSTAREASGELKLGLYRNHNGIELHVVQPVLDIGRLRTLGGIFLAEDRDGLFGTQQLLVTAHAMAQSGYTLIEEAS